MSVVLFTKIKQHIKPFFIAMFMLLFFGIAVYAEASVISDDVLVVGIPADRCPMFYLDDDTDEPIGIGVDLMQIVGEEAGYHVSFKVIKEKTNKDALDNPKYNVIMPFGSAITSASNKETIVTDNLIQTPFTMVTKPDKELSFLDNMHIGMLSSLAGGAETVKQLYPDIEITLYETMDDCVDALRHDEVDALLHNAYVWSYVLQKPSYADLKVQPTTMFSMDFRVGTLDTPEGRVIVDRLNSGIGKLTDTQIQSVILDYTSRRLYKNTLMDTLYEYKYFLTLSFLIFVFIISCVVFKYRSIHEEQERKIRELQEHDVLTGALNLEGFRRRVDELLRKYPENRYCLVFSNIRNFKFINDSMGRQVGDDLLRFWTESYTKVLSDEEAIGRIAGDRFAVLRKITYAKQIHNDDKMFIDPVRSYFTDRNQDIKIQVCTGIYALTSDDYKDIDVDRMIDYARLAELKAKDTYKTNYEFYNPDQWEKNKQIANISGYLQTAIQNGEVQVWYQPQVDYETGDIIYPAGSGRPAETQDGLLL